ncbi:MAG TPA: asparagine synthase (glutamine-hydrolyzing) [Rubricoccaceae bacterium]|jgi:asparagine synthase (glutamine-hydrolysing)
MCGIAAVLDRTGRGVDPDALARVGAHMARRGPDGHGVWTAPDGRAGLAHRRLAIIDLSVCGAQPMHSADGRLSVAFNGEIYNYRALRTQLEADGARFASESDTEVLLHLYARHGAGLVDHLRGMYAFTLWDAERGGMLLARDPYGIKPLYVADDGRTFRAASQVKALLAGGGIDTAPEPAGHAGFFLWGSVPEPYTLYRGIRALPAGHTLWADAGGPRDAVPFASVPDAFRSGTRTAPNGVSDGAPGSLREALLDSVRAHLVADVPVGVFLSAGRDSATLAALAAEIGGTLKTVTLGFEEFRGTSDDEVPLAEAVARHVGAEHQTVWTTARDFADARTDLLAAMDQPTLDGVNTYFVSRAAAQTGLKVALSGVGGDELFGGYPSFREVPRLVRAMRPVPAALGRAARVATAPLLRRVTSPKAAGLAEYGGTWGGAYLLRRALFMPYELGGILGRDMARAGLAALRPLDALNAAAARQGSDHARVAAMESVQYMRNQLLRDTDWASMAHSLEVRTPLVDWTLLSALAPDVAGHSERVSKEALAATPRPALPAGVLSRPKTGFSIPVREWLAGEEHAERGLRGWTRTVYEAFTG